MANTTAGGAGALALSLSTQLAVGGVFRGQLATGESDLLRVDLVAGQTYSFAALGLGAGGLGVTDSRLVLRSATGEVLWGDESSGPGDFADLVFTASTTGAYILEVSSNASGALGGYGVTMAKGVLASLTVMRETDCCCGVPKLRQTCFTPVEMTKRSALSLRANRLEAQSLSITASTPTKFPAASRITGMPPPPAATTII